MRHTPLALLLLLAACHRGPAPNADATPEWRATRIAVIGDDTGRTSFGRIRSLLFSTRGELYVVDEQAAQILVFDSTGTFLRPLGRKGAGPGEYGRPYSVAWLHDTLALLDPGNSRIGLFAPGGAWAGTLPVQPISGGASIRLYRGDSTAFWAYGFKVIDRKPQNIFVRYTGAGPHDTLPYVRSADPIQQITCEGTDRSIRFYDDPFAGMDLLIPTSATERAFARTDAYRIFLLGPRGDTLRMLTHDEPLRPISDSAWGAGLADWNAFHAANPGAKCDGDGFQRPDHQPVLAALIAGPEGRLWVEVRTANGPRYDLWEGALRVAHVTGLPSSAEVDPAFLGDLVALPLLEGNAGPEIGIFRLTRTP